MDTKRKWTIVVSIVLLMLATTAGIGFSNCQCDDYCAGAWIACCQDQNWTACYVLYTQCIPALCSGGGGCGDPIEPCGRLMVSQSGMFDRTPFGPLVNIDALGESTPYAAILA
jgi:hypothetical protein